MSKSFERTWGRKNVWTHEFRIICINLSMNIVVVSLFSLFFFRASFSGLKLKVNFSTISLCTANILKIVLSSLIRFLRAFANVTATTTPLPSSSWIIPCKTNIYCFDDIFLTAFSTPFVTLENCLLRNALWRWMKKWKTFAFCIYLQNIIHRWFFWHLTNMHAFHAVNFCSRIFNIHSSKKKIFFAQHVLMHSQIDGVHFKSAKIICLKSKKMVRKKFAKHPVRIVTIFDVVYFNELWLNWELHCVVCFIFLFVSRLEYWQLLQLHWSYRLFVLFQQQWLPR